MKPRLPEQSVGGDQPAVTVVEISDPAIAGQGLELVALDAVQLTSIPFRARRVVVRLEGGAVLYHSTNHRHALPPLPIPTTLTATSRIWRRSSTD